MGQLLRATLGGAFTFLFGYGCYKAGQHGVDWLPGVHPQKETAQTSEEPPSVRPSEPPAPAPAAPPAASDNSSVQQSRRPSGRPSPSRKSMPARRHTTPSAYDAGRAVISTPAVPLENRLVPEMMRRADISGTCGLPHDASAAELQLYGIPGQHFNQVMDCGGGHHVLLLNQQYAGQVQNGESGRYINRFLDAQQQAVRMTTYDLENGVLHILESAMLNDDGTTTTAYASPVVMRVVKSKQVINDAKGKAHKVEIASLQNISGKIEKGMYCAVSAVTRGKDVVYACDLYRLDKKGRPGKIAAPVAFSVTGDAVRVAPQFDLSAKQNHDLKDLYNDAIPKYQRRQ